VLWLKVGLRGGGTCQAGWPARVVGRWSFVAALTLGIGCYMHWPSLTHWQSGIWKGANTWPAARPHFGLVGPGLCATSSPHVIFSVTMPYFGHIEDMHRFWSIWCFFIIRCSWNSRKCINLVENLKFPNGYSVGFRRAVNLESGKLNGVKSHEYHRFMERLLLVMFPGYLDDDV
jgi:hypothetical protein